MIKNGIMLSQEEAKILLDLIGFKTRDEYGSLAQHYPERLEVLSKFRSIVRDGEEDDD
jgi:hypothetical protein